MKIKEINPEVLYAEDEYRSFSLAEAEALAAKAMASRTGKVRICLHRSPDEHLHEMLIAMRKDNKYPAHAHKNSEETFYLVLGRARLELYGDDGGKTAEILLGDASTGFATYARIPIACWHRLTIESEVCVFLETKLGPFSPADSMFADFSPTDDGGQ